MTSSLCRPAWKLVVVRIARLAGSEPCIVRHPTFADCSACLPKVFSDNGFW